jgi:hypothetical protein
MFRTRRGPGSLDRRASQPLLADLATVTKNTLRLSGRRFDKITTPTPLQQKALNLLKVSL